MDLRLLPEQFALLCKANPAAVLELTADCPLILFTPTGGDTGARNHTLSLALGLAARLCAVLSPAGLVALPRGAHGDGQDTRADRGA